MLFGIEENEEVEGKEEQPQHHAVHHQQQPQRRPINQQLLRNRSSRRMLMLDDQQQQETLNEAMECNDNHVPNYRDYLHAQRSLKSFRGVGGGLHSSPSNQFNNSAAASSRNLNVGNGNSRSVNAAGEIKDRALPSSPTLTRTRNTTPTSQDEGEEMEEDSSSSPFGLFVGTRRKREQQQRNEKDDREQQNERAFRRSIHSVAVAAGGRASIMTTDPFLWETIMELDDDDDDDLDLLGDDDDEKHNANKQHDHDEDPHQHHSPAGVIPWYSPPMQRVFYGKPQVLPHVNWGDLFFDLFFVAAAYNLGVLLISAMTNDTDWVRGLIYFIGIFGALYQSWYNDLSFSSRYTVVDHVHRLLGFMKFFCVGIAIMFIKPLSFMGDPKSIETLAFLIAITCESILSLGLSIEIYYRAIGDRTPIEKHTKRAIRNYHLPTLAFYTAALTLSAISFLKDDHDDSSTNETIVKNDGGDTNSTTRLLLASSADVVSCSSGSRLLFSRMLGATDMACPTTAADGHRRSLATSATDDTDDCTCHSEIKLTVDDIPLGIVMLTYIFNIAFSFLRSLCLAGNGKGKDIRDRFVPNNLDYLIHRYGEWILLMIGEGILSLLIVETTESKEYFTVSCFGVLTVMGIHILVFESQPSTSQGHAIYRSLRAQMLFGLLVQILSMGLIAFGVCFKIMLTTIVEQEEEMLYSSGGRRLAATAPVSNDATTALFSGSLTIILLTLELMLATHKGVKGLYKHHLQKGDGVDLGIIRKLNIPMVAVSLIRVGLIVFAGTISQWEDELTRISVIAFLIVAAMSVCRVIGWGLVHKEEEIRFVLETIIKAPKDVADSVSGMKRQVTKTIKKIGSNMVPSNSTSWRSFVGVDNRDSSSNREEEDFNEKAEWRSSFRPAWDASLDSIIVIDRSGIIQYSNRTAVKEFRYDSANELMGKDVAILAGGGEAKNHHLYMKRMEDGREPSKFVGQHSSLPKKDGKQRILHGRRKDGSEFPCMIGLKSVQDTDLIVGFIQNLSDLAGMENFTKEEFIFAASTGDSEEIKLLLSDSTVHINEGDYDERRALHLAAENGHAEVVQMLCDAGADVNVSDRWGNHPLDGAVERHHTECIRILKSFGASRSKTASISDFVNAAATGDAEKVKAILDEGNINIDEGERDGRSALHLAVSAGRLSVVKLLCESGANVNAPDRWNHKPLDEAEKSEEYACAAILKKFGAENSRREVWDKSIDAIVISDYQGIIKRVNQTTLNSFGYSTSEEVVGKNVSILVGGTHAAHHDAYLQNFNDEEKKPPSSAIGKQRILHGRRKDGSEFPCLILLKRKEKEKRLVAFIRDMSDLAAEGAIAISSSEKEVSDELSVDSAQSA